MDLTDDKVYQKLVIEKLSGIEKMLYRIVGKEPDLTTPKRSFNSSQKFNQSAIELASREIANTDVVNFLPANTLQEVIDLECTMRTNPKIFKDVTLYVRLRRPTEDNQLTQALRMILSDEVMYEFNWQGLNGRNKMSDLQLFSKIVYDEWFKERLSFPEYVNEMKFALVKVHKRLQKKRHRWSRRLVDETICTV